MGLLDGIFRQENSTIVEIDIQHALVIIMLKTMQIDKVNHSSELLVISQIMCKSPIFSDNDDKADARVIDASKRYISGNIDALDGASAILSTELKETAFAMAVEIIFADHVITDNERKFIDVLASKLAVSAAKARSIVETFDILYRATV